MGVLGRPVASLNQLGRTKNESLKKYFRRVRYLGDLALCE